MTVEEAEVVNAKEEWFEPEFGEARRRYAELEHDPDRKPARAALERVHSSITEEEQDHELPGPAPRNDRLLDRIGPIYSKIDHSYSTKLEEA